MLPLLTTIGSGLAWFATYVGQLIVMGFGLGAGLWSSRQITDRIDLRRAKKMGRRLWPFGRHETEEAVAVATVANPAPA